MEHLDPTASQCDVPEPAEREDGIDPDRRGGAPEIPRGRDGTFVLRLVPRGDGRVGGLDEVIISLYAGGMTVRDIEHHLASTIDTHIWLETSSTITDSVLDEVLEVMSLAHGIGTLLTS